MQVTSSWSIFIQLSIINFGPESGAWEKFTKRAISLECEF